MSLWRRLRRATRARAATPEGGGRAGELLELSRAVGGDWGASIRRIVQFEADALEVERVSFWSLCDTSRLHCDAGYVSSLRLFDRGATLTKAACLDYFEAIHQGHLLSVEDVAAEPRLRGLRERFARHAVSSILDVPVLIEGRVVGVLRHEHVGPNRRWTSVEIDFATGVAQVIASAAAARRQSVLESAAARAECFDILWRELARSLEVHDVARRALAVIVSRLADVALVHMLNQEGALDCVATDSLDPKLRDLVAEIGRLEAHQVEPPGLPAMVVRQAQSVIHRVVTPADLERYGLRPTLRARLGELGLRSSMGAPLMIGDRILGALSFMSTDRCFEDGDLELAEQVGGRVAAALENARLYTMARDAVRLRDEFLVLAAHELRTPLTVLDLEVSRMRRRGDAGETIPRQVRRLGALVEQMLDVSRIRSQGVTLALDPCDLAEIVDERVRRRADDAKSAGVSISVAVHADVALAGQWDRARLEQMVDYLIDNAIKFGERKPINVVLEREGAQAVLVVRDHGIGIPPDRLSSIFAPFERAVPQEHFGGLGLGLFIAKAIVDAHGGSITATSRVAEGSTFVVRLPLAVARHEAPIAAPRAMA